MHPRLEGLYDKKLYCPLYSDGLSHPPVVTRDAPVNLPASGKTRWTEHLLSMNA